MENNLQNRKGDCTSYLREECIRGCILLSTAVVVCVCISLSLSLSFVFFYFVCLFCFVFLTVNNRQYHSTEPGATDHI